MARIRTIKPEFFTSETIADLTIPARLTFVGLWTEADDYGVCLDNSRVIKGSIWPLDDAVTAGDVSDHLDQMERHGHVCRWEADGRRWLHICGFPAHQSISHPSKRRLPTPPGHVDEVESEPTPSDQHLPESSGESPEPSGGSPRASANLSAGKGKGKGKGKGNTLPSRLPDDSAAPTPEAGAPPRRDALFDALCEVCGVTPAELTTTGRGAINTALRDLRAVSATPDEIRARAGRWSFSVKLTAPGLAKHWATLGRPTVVRPAMNAQPIHIAETNGHRADPSRVAQLRPIRKDNE